MKKDILIFGSLVVTMIAAWMVIYICSTRDHRFGTEIVKLGSYNGQEIEWCVLGDVLISKDAIKVVNTVDLIGKNWSNSNVRQWLNNEFFNQAFNDREKEMLVETAIKEDEEWFFDYVNLNDVSTLLSDKYKKCKYNGEPVKWYTGNKMLIDEKGRLNVVKLDDVVYIRPVIYLNSGDDYELYYDYDKIKDRATLIEKYGLTQEEGEQLGKAVDDIVKQSKSQHRRLEAAYYWIYDNYEAKSGNYEYNNIFRFFLDSMGFYHDRNHGIHGLNYYNENVNGSIVYADRISIYFDIAQDKLKGIRKRPGVFSTYKYKVR